ncbi:MAG: V8-like Glu-specific endopeptidase [Bacteriovoracaceae bacterium]|jgi:V8-like Glu-specific endopeptidase
MKTFILLLCVVFTTSASALDLPANLSDQGPQNGLLDDSSRNFNYDFEGIIKLSNCSGSLIKFSGQPDTSKAYVLTNGHCVQKSGGYLEPGEVWFNKPMKRKMEVFTKDMNLFTVNATKISYATMTGTDSAIYQLKETYKDISKYGIEPFLLDANHPIIGTSIDIVSGYWDRGYRCFIDGFVFELLEGDWTFTDSIRFSNMGCKTKGGTSGSPITQTDTRVVIGVNNTGNMQGKRCTLSNPCENDADGNITVRRRSYGQQTYHFSTCLTPDFKIDLKIPGCLLPK